MREAPCHHAVEPTEDNHMVISDASVLGGAALRPIRDAADLPGIEAVRSAVRRVEGDAWLPGPAGADVAAGAAEDVRRRCLVAEARESAEIVGFTWMDSWHEADGTQIYLLTGCVRPDWRRRGLGRAMLSWQEEQARVATRDGGSGGPVVLGGNASEGQPDTRALLLASGYRVAFTVVEMAVEPDPIGGGHVAEVRSLPSALHLRPVEPACHRAIHDAVEACFAGSRNGYRSRTFEEYLNDVQDTDLWLVAWDGDVVAALVVNERQADGSVLTPWVAVRPRWRRRGVASTLMTASLRLLATHGVPRAHLTTIQENANDSVGLYEKVGYRVVNRQPRYRKALSRPVASAS